MKNITIITSGHPPFDERIYWKFARSFRENGWNTVILCSTMEINQESEGVLLHGFNGENLSKREKINKFISSLEEFKPDVIICCEPLTIIAAARYRKVNKTTKVIADITEWYPENVASKYPYPQRLLKFIFLYLFNIYTVNKADALIIGETAKKKRYDLIAPFKKKEIIGYYPVVKYFKYSLPELYSEFVLCYAGLISFERGIKMLVRAASEIAKRHPYLKIKVKLVGKFQYSSEEEEFSTFTKQYKNVNVENAGWTSYDKISDYLQDVHLCFDLRIRNFIYKNSLPIKVFEYMAAGKPFIYSDIKPIREELNFEYCGHLVNPNNLKEICETAEKYLKDRELLSIHSRNGRMIIEKEKNWERESVKLISFINQILV
jgi:glycosyltransferase involved in cell wall biosynthesis